MKKEEMISNIIETELEKITYAYLLEIIRKKLITPRVEFRDWDYGEPNQNYPCWIVVEDEATSSVIAYCEHGFSDSWGLIPLDPKSSMGMDSNWFISLEDAIRNSEFWDGDNPLSYEVN